MAYKCLISRKKEKHKQPLPNFTEFTSFAYKNEQNNADLNNNEITQKPESNQDHHEISFSENTKSLEQNRKKIEKLNFKVIYVTNDLVNKNVDEENYDFIFYDDIFYGLLSEYWVVLDKCYRKINKFVLLFGKIVFKLQSFKKLLIIVVNFFLKNNSLIL